jgi:phospholipid/cholesterol/gamma-HCH transport system substrate-binding protein
MTTLIQRNPMRAVSLGVVAVLVLALFLVVLPGGGSRTLTAHFERATAVYPGTDVRVMGVSIGEVTAVVPDGNSVRVEMKYSDEYKLPADAKAAVVTPTLVADRYVQVFPAYDKGAVMADGGDISLDRTSTPIELDRMYQAIDDLSTTLGPKSGSTSGALGNLLSAGAKALNGNGTLGSRTLRNLSAAADTFAQNRGPLFDNVRALAEITDTLARNDSTVQAFLTQLTSTSSQLAGERDEIQQVLESLAKVLGTVKGFVHDNRAALGRNVDLLSSLLERVDNQKDALGLVAQKGALAMGNLAVAFEPNTGTFGSRVQIPQGLQLRPDQFLCQTLVNAGAPQSICTVISNLLQPLLPATKDDVSAPAPQNAPSSGGTPSAPPADGSTGSTGKAPSLFSLLGGGRG